MSESKEETFKELRDRLVKTGEWERIMRILLHRLNEHGWIDAIRDQSKERARSMEELNFAGLMDDMLPKATETVPNVVKQEVAAMLLHFFQGELH